METEKENEAWRRGYDLGVKNTLKENNVALIMGHAILSALDERYEFKKEDY